jgi:hypothetical protein
MALLSPWLLLLALLAVVPVAAIVGTRRRQRRAAAALGLRPVSGTRVAAEAALAVLALAALAVVAATPVRWQRDTVGERKDAQAYLVIDTSRSMLARRNVEAPDRLETARTTARYLAAALPADVPIGLAAFHDQPLPLVAPTVDRDALRDTLPNANISLPTSPMYLSNDSYASGTPQSSNYAALVVAAVSSFYSPGTEHRLLFFLTDDDTSSYDAGAVGRILRRAGITLFAIRVGSASDRLFYQAGGRVRIDAGYRFAAKNARLLASTAEETGGRLVHDWEAGEAVSFTARKLGPPEPSKVRRLTIEQAPEDMSLVPALVAVAALVALAVSLRLGTIVRTPRPLAPPVNRSAPTTHAR